VTEAIDADIDLTLRRVKLFQRDGPMHDDLRNLLLAYSVFHSPSPRYVRAIRRVRTRAHGHAQPPGASWPAALLLISMPVQDAFVSLANLVEKSFLKSFYLDKNDEVRSVILPAFVVSKTTGTDAGVLPRLWYAARRCYAARASL
jgi:hypothetical protein